MFLPTSKIITDAFKVMNMILNYFFKVNMIAINFFKKTDTYFIQWYAFVAFISRGLYLKKLFLKRN